MKLNNKTYRFIQSSTFNGLLIVLAILWLSSFNDDQVNNQSEHPQIDSLVQLTISGQPDAYAALIQNLDAAFQGDSGNRPGFEYLFRIIKKVFEAGRHGMALDLIEWVQQAEPLLLTPFHEFQLLTIQLDVYVLEESLDSSKAILEKMKALTKEPAGFDGWQPKFLFAQAIVASMEHRFFDALKLLSDLQFHYGNTLEKDFIMYMKVQQGGIFVKLQRYDLALPLLREAKIQAASIEHGYPDLFKLLNNNLGIAYMRQDSFERAVHCFTSILGQASKSENPILASQMFHNLATAKRLDGKFDEALSFSDSTIALCTKYRVPVGVIFGKLGRAKTLLEMGEARKASEELTKAEVLLLEFPIPELKEEWNLLAARANWALGKYKKAYTELQLVFESEKTAREEQINHLINAWEVQLKNNQAEKRALDTEIQLEGERFVVRQLLFASVLLVTIIIGGFLYIMKRRQREEIISRLVEKEKENTKLLLEIKNRELASKSLDVQKALGVRDMIVKKLKKLNADNLDDLNQQLKVLIGEIQNSLPEGLWEDFKHRFENVERDFIPKLLQQCPDLTPIELKTATFLRLNLSTKEIASLTNRAAGTVNNNRSALRKKLNIDNDENLMIFLLSL